MSNLYFVLTKQCNQFCNSCPRHNEQRIPDERIDTILYRITSTIQKFNIQNLILSGGEPSVYPHFPKLISVLSSLKLSVLIQSNGLRFCEKSYLEKCFPNTLNVSKFHFLTAIHSINSHTHDNVTNVSGSFQKTLCGIHNLLNKGIHVTVKCIVGQHNYHELPAFYDFIMSEFQEQADICISGMDYIGMNQKEAQQYAIDYARITKPLEKMISRDICRPDQRQMLAVIELPLCIVDSYYFSRFRNTKTDRMLFQDAHMDRPSRRVHDFYPCAEKCKNCPLQSFCPGLWRTQYLYYGENAVRGINSSDKFDG